MNLVDQMFQSLEGRTLLSASLVLPPSPTDLTSRSTASVVSADFDGDGLTDLVASQGNTIAFYRGAPDGTFAAAVRTVLPAAVGKLAVGRFNGDLLPDVASIAPVQGGGESSGPIAMLVRVLYFDAATRTFTVGARLRLGDGTGAASSRIVTGNFRGGWRDEILVSLGTKVDVRLLELPDRNTLVQTGLTAHSDSATLRDMAVFHGYSSAFPGRPALLTLVQEQYSQSLVVTIVGPNGPRPTPIARRVTSFDRINYFNIAVGDLDGDGQEDVVLGGEYGRSAVVIGYTQAGWVPARELTEIIGRIDGIADINGDGRADILATIAGSAYPQDWPYPGGLEVHMSLALAQADGTFQHFSAGKTLSYEWSGDTELGYALAGGLIAHVGSLGRPAVVQFSTRGINVSVATDALFGPLVSNVGAGADLGPGGSLLRTGNLYAMAYDQDPMRGGHAVRVQWVLDLDQNGVADDTDPVLGEASAVSNDGFWRARYTLDDAWAAGRYTLFVRSFDNDGLASPWVGVRFDIPAP